jgi:hypothetical protein
VVTQGGPDELGKLIWQAAQRWLPKDRDGAPLVRGRVVFLSDGATWLARMAQEWLPGARVVLDFFHVAEHIAQAARVLHPDDELARKRWTKRQRELLLRGEVTAMLGGLLLAAKNKRRTAEARTELQHLHDYMAERQTALCYLVQLPFLPPSHALREFRPFPAAFPPALVFGVYLCRSRLCHHPQKLGRRLDS